MRRMPTYQSLQFAFAHVAHLKNNLLRQPYTFSSVVSNKHISHDKIAGRHGEKTPRFHQQDLEKRIEKKLTTRMIMT